jgi:hypothetical protein
MKSITKLIASLLLAALPFTLLSQGQTVIAAYMKVSQERYMEYPEVEKAWKKYHQKAIEEGVCNGWQLWRSIHAGIHDPYQYITLQWYDNYEQAIKGNDPANAFDGVYSDEEWAALNAKTNAARVYAYQEVSHLITQVDNPQPLKYLVVHRMKANPGMADEYVQMETEIFKAYHEELIKRDQLAHWGLWNIWPYKKDQCRYVTVNGYKDAAQLDADSEVIDPQELGLDYTLEEVTELAQKTRVKVTDEVWELIDQVWPEEE